MKRHTGSDLLLAREIHAAGAQAAKAGQMAVLRLARAEDGELLDYGGAYLVVTGLDEVSLEALAEGRLEQVGVRRWNNAS